MADYIINTTDDTGRPVVLYEDNWLNHVKKDHFPGHGDSAPAMIQRSVEEPHAVYESGQTADRHVYERGHPEEVETNHNRLKWAYLRTIVHIAEEPAAIVTSFITSESYADKGSLIRRRIEGQT